MLRRLWMFLALALVIAATIIPTAPAVSDTTVDFSSHDAEMNAAIEKARNSIEKFWREFELRAPDTSGFSLKVRIDEGGAGEHFWAHNIERNGGTIYGVLAGEPQLVVTVKEGDRIEIKESQISDWMYWRG